MTQGQLATRLGFKAHAYISEMETGRKEPTAKLVVLLAAVFSVSTDDLLRDELQLGDRPR